MDSQVTCNRIEEQLEAFAAGTLADDEFLKLMGHVDRCPDCAMLLRLHQHTAAVPTEELKAGVPDHLVDGMYGRVMDEIREKVPRHSRLSVRRPVFKWLVPALSTAVALLLVGGGLMIHELRELRQREEALSDCLERQEHFMRERGVVPPSFTGIDNRLVLSSHEGMGVFTRQEKTSIAELLSVLEELPSSTQILDVKETAKLLARYNRWMSSVTWNEATAGIDVHDGLQVDEMIRLIHTLDPDPDTRIPTARLVSLSHRTAPRARPLGD